MAKVPKATPNNNPFHEKDTTVDFVKPKADVIRDAGFTPKPVIAEKAEVKMREGINQYSPCQKSDKPSIDTKKELAKAAGVSHDTIAKVEKIERQAAPGICTAI